MRKLNYYALLLIIVFLIASCESMKNRKKLVNSSLIDTPKNGKFHGEIIFKFNPKDYNLDISSIQNVYISPYFLSSDVNKTIFFPKYFTYYKHFQKTYLVKMKKGSNNLIVPIKMEWIKGDIFKKEIVLPDRMFIYYFNVTFQSHVSERISAIFFPSIGPVAKDLNNRCTYEGMHSVGQNYPSVIEIENGKLKYIYNVNSYKQKYGKIDRVIINNKTNLIKPYKIEVIQK